MHSIRLSMNIILFDSAERHFLNPFAYTQPVAHIRAGLFNNVERWQRLTGLPVYTLSPKYLQADEPRSHEEAIVIDARIIPQQKDLVDKLLNLEKAEALIQNNQLIGGRWSGAEVLQMPVSFSSFQKHIHYVGPVTKIVYAWELFQLNDSIIRSDIDLLANGTKFIKASSTNALTAAENIFIEAGAAMEHCIINAATGPVYIGRNATIMEGSIIRGPVVIGEGAVVKAGTKIYGGTTVGPYCTVGGEIKNSILMGYSNKAHDGYLGDSVIGHWCNLGAGTSNSNLKNDAGLVQMKLGEDIILTVGQKCGLLMGDYTRCAINTSFNTGTFAGVAGNVFGAGLSPKFLSNFTWGYTERYQLDKCFTHIDNWKKLKQQNITQTEIAILTHLYNK